MTRLADPVPSEFAGNLPERRNGPAIWQASGEFARFKTGGRRLLGSGQPVADAPAETPRLAGGQPAQAFATVRRRRPGPSSAPAPPLLPGRSSLGKTRVVKAWT